MAILAGLPAFIFRKCPENIGKRPYIIPHKPKFSVVRFSTFYSAFVHGKVEKGRKKDPTNACEKKTLLALSIPAFKRQKGVSPPNFKKEETTYPQ